MKQLPIVLTALALLGATAMPAAAQAPCGGPVTGLQINPRTVYFVASPDHETVTHYQIGVFLQGVDPVADANAQPITSVTIPKEQLTAVAGVANCYSIQPNATVLFGAPITAVTPYTGSVKAIRTTDETEAAWSPVSNPFVKSGTVRPAGRPVFGK